MEKYEYMLHTWGGFYNDEHKKEHGQKPGYFWFNTKSERDSYLNLLLEFENKFNARMLAFDIAEGENTRVKTIAKMVFIFKGKEYPYEEDFGYAYPLGLAEYMFEHGNYSCDCNRSIFIQRNYSHFPEMQCGNKIKMKDFKVIYIHGSDKQFEEKY